MCGPRVNQNNFTPNLTLKTWARLDIRMTQRVDVLNFSQWVLEEEKGVNTTHTHTQGGWSHWSTQLHHLIQSYLYTQHSIFHLLLFSYTNYKSFLSVWTVPSLPFLTVPQLYIPIFSFLFEREKNFPQSSSTYFTLYSLTELFVLYNEQIIVVSCWTWTNIIKVKKKS